MTWFIPLLYSILKTFSSQVLTSKSLIWVQMITLGLFATQNEILVWIWSITLSLHFGKPKFPIFFPKCYTALIFTPKRPYGHRKDCSWTQTQCIKCFDTKISYYDFKGFCWLRLYDSFTFYSKLFPHMFCLQNLSFGSKWLPSACLPPKMKF